MNPDLFWIPGPWSGRLAVVTRPRGGDWLDDEINGWRSAGLNLVVSLLEPEEAGQLELDREADLARSKGIDFLSSPIPDRGVPASPSAVLSLFKAIAYALEQGRNVAIHCRQGIGRSGLIAAGMLVNSGIGADQAIETVSAARGLTVPETSGQLDWIHHLASDRLATVR